MLTGAALVALVASAVLGSNLFGLRDRLVGPDAEVPVTSRAAGQPAAPGPDDRAAGDATVLRSHPWWQEVGEFRGDGPDQVPSFTIDDRALQWRVSWDCELGTLRVGADDAGGDLPVDASCPDTGESYRTTTGPVTLEVSAQGPWTVTVAQQIDLPLEEPPLPAMQAPGSREVASGELYRIDQAAQGTITLHELPDGSYAFRLESFFVTPNVDLELQLSPLAAPRTSEEVQDAPATTVTVLDVTAGSLNVPVPDDLDPTAFRSVIIWCEPILSAYAAASLAPA